MIEEIKLVICDIDGTLLRTGEPISERTLDVFRRLHKQGVYLGLASGRNLLQLNRTPREWGLDFDFEINIGMNGSEVWDGINQKRHDYFKLKVEWMKEIIELMKPFDLNPFIYWRDGMLASRMDERTRASGKRNRSNVTIAKDISELYAEENAKLLFRVEEERMAEVEAYVNQHPSPYYKAFKTQTTMLEFMDHRVSKAVALEKICEFTGIKPEQIMAFGDMTNDDEMLQFSGWGVCLANGHEYTKSISDDVTEYPCEEDGFARYMEEKVLNPRGW